MNGAEPRLLLPRVKIELVDDVPGHLRQVAARLGAFCCLTLAAAEEDRWAAMDIRPLLAFVRGEVPLGVRKLEAATCVALGTLGIGDDRGPPLERLAADLRCRARQAEGAIWRPSSLGEAEVASRAALALLCRRLAADILVVEHLILPLTSRGLSPFEHDALRRRLVELARAWPTSPEPCA